MLLVVFDCLAVSFEMFVVHMYLKTFFDTRSARLPPLLTYVPFVAISVFLSLTAANMFLLLAVTFLRLFVVASVVFRASLQSRLFASVVFCFIAVTCEALSSLTISVMSTSLLTAVLEYGSLRIISSILAVLIFIAVIKAMSIFIKRRESSPAKKLREVAPPFVYIMFSIFLLCGRFYDTYISEGTLSLKIVVEIVAIIYMVVIVFWYYDRILLNYELRHEKEVNDSTLKYYDLVQKQHDKLAELRHDIGKHMRVMEGLVAGASPQQASQYLDGYKDVLMATRDTVSTQHPVVSVILSDCVSRALDLGIEPVLDVELPPTFDLDAIDITTILGNTIENALRALSVMPYDAPRSLSILLRQRGNFMVYEICNSYVPSEHLDSLRTRYGLRNVRKCVDSHHGSLDASGDTHTFSLRITMPI